VFDLSTNEWNLLRCDTCAQGFIYDFRFENGCKPVSYPDCTADEVQNINTGICELDVNCGPGDSFYVANCKDAKCIEFTVRDEVPASVSDNTPTIPEKKL